MSDHEIRFVERTLASVRCACICGWKAEVMTGEGNRQAKLNKLVAEHLGETSPHSSTHETGRA